MPNAAIYTRLSQDRDGSKSATDRQERDCRALCKREGLKVGAAAVYTDDDRSAYNGKGRPAFDQLLKDLEQYDALVYWKTDRLVRRTIQFWRVVEACEKANVRLISVMDPIDTSTPLGKGVAGMLAAVGEQESHNIAVRVARKDQENAAKGKPHGGARAFGYSKDNKIDRSEARAVREARDRILAGESMFRICTDWNERGVKPTMGAAWRVVTFKRMITGPRVAGLRQYRGEVVATASWAGIITPEDRLKIIATLGDPKRRGRRATYLLSGLIRCGKCGCVMRRGVDAGRGKWTCQRVPGEEDSHCGRASVTADPVDALVEEAILYRLDSPAVAREIARPKRKQEKKDDADDIDVLEARLVQLGKDHDSGLISRAEWLARRTPLARRIEAARAALVRTNGADPLAEFAKGIDVQERWATLPIEARRKVASALIESVTISAPVKRSNKFDPDRVVVEWRV